MARSREECAKLIKTALGESWQDTVKRGAPKGDLKGLLYPLTGEVLKGLQNVGVSIEEIVGHGFTTTLSDERFLLIQKVEAAATGQSEAPSLRR